MWKSLWRKWTIDKPAALGDWLWQVLVIDLAAFLERFTPRRVIALLPIAIIVIAYAHQIPLPPELMLVGDILAYLDIISVMLLLGLIGRMTMILHGISRAAEHLLGLAYRVRAGLRRPDSRFQRARRAGRRLLARARKDDDGDGCSAAWHAFGVSTV